MSWYVVRTQSNQEDKACFNLKKQGFEIYLPRYNKTIRHARKTQTVKRPLFPGYLFVNIDLENARWRSVNGTYGVISFIQFGDKPQSISSDIIEQIILAEDARGSVVLDNDEFKVGDRVRLCEGPFVDHVGFLQEKNDDSRVFLLLNYMGREVRVQAPLHSLAVAS